MFELIARIVAYFYQLTSSYGAAILMLTVLVMAVVMPLTFKSTKSMIEMRRIQPQIKKIQTRFAKDRDRMNKELMELYQRHGVNPVGGCLPVLVQAPVFFVLFRVVRGLTRRVVDVSYGAGNALTGTALVETGTVSEVTISTDKGRLNNFNPEYLGIDTNMYKDLVTSHEMLSVGIDLSRSASEVIRESITASVPFLILVVITGLLSWYQQQQIQGRTTTEMTPQMQAITKLMPWMAPLFAFTLPAALGVYFIGSALFRVGQNTVITRRFYHGVDEDFVDEAFDEDDDDDDPDDSEPSDSSSPAGGLGALLGGGAASKPTTASTGNRHGSRSPVSGGSSSRKRIRPPRDTPVPTKSAGTKSAGTKSTGTKSAGTKSTGTKSAGTKSTSTKSTASAGAAAEEGGSLWSRAKRSANARAEEGGASDARGRGGRGSAKGRNTPSETADTTARKQSRRVTPKGGPSNPKKKN